MECWTVTFTEIFWKDFGFLFNPLQLSALVFISSSNETSVPLPPRFTQLWKHEWEGMSAQDKQVIDAIRQWNCSLIIFLCENLFFSWASVLVPILWAQAVNADVCPGHCNQWSCLAAQGADVVRLLLLSGSNCKMQAVAHSFRGNFVSLKLMVLERLLICYLLIKVREGVINGEWRDFSPCLHLLFVAKSTSHHWRKKKVTS